MLYGFQHSPLIWRLKHFCAICQINDMASIYALIFIFAYLVEYKLRILSIVHSTKVTCKLSVHRVLCLSKGLPSSTTFKILPK